MKAAIKWSLTAAFLLGLTQYLTCAARGRPGGGPVDKIPPEIIYTFPQSDSVNISNLKKIEIYFSERMNEGSVSQSLFISPPLEYDVDWSGGDEITLEITETLQSNRTYLITIGSGAMDAHNNRLSASYQLAFSTGPNLDQGQISGQIYGISTKDVLYIYAYQKDHPDSLNPTVTKADYLSQPSEDGRFHMKYLPYGEYRIFVVEDQNKNLLLDANYERVGIPFRDVEIDSMSQTATDLNFRVTRIDTVGPMMTGARAINNRKILLRFSEPVRTPGMLTIIDTISARQLPLLGSETNPENISQWYIYTSPQEDGSGYKILTSNLSDTSGNITYVEQGVTFSGSAEIDTTEFDMTSVTPGDSARNVRYPASVEFKFSLPVDTISLQEAFLCLNEAGDTLKGIWEFETLSDVIYRPGANFLPGRQYYLQVNQANVRSLFGNILPDSLVQHTFFMISDDEFGSLSGSSNLDSTISELGYINVYPVSGRAQSMQAKLDKNNTFFVQWISDGEYRIGGFLDRDRNGKYSFGQLFPFEFSEPVFINPDTVKVRKRWELAGIEASYPGVE